MENGQVIFVDFYADVATLSNSGTQSATFYRVRLSNTEKFSETWHSIAIEPMTKNMPPSFPAEKERSLKSLMLQKFLFTIFRSMICRSYSDVMVNGVLLFTRFSMHFCDQPEERALSV